jgi:hypothetical protein
MLAMIPLHHGISHFVWSSCYRPTGRVLAFLKRRLRNCDLTLRVALCAPVAFPVGALAAV